MPMQIVMCMMENRAVPFFEIDGLLYTTGAVLAWAFDVTVDNIRHMRRLHADKFRHLLSGNAIPAKDQLLACLAENRELFRVQRIREDMMLFESRDAIKMAFYCRSQRAADFTDVVIETYHEHMLAHRLQDFVSKADYQQMLERVLQLEEQRKETLAFSGAQLSKQRWQS